MIILYGSFARWDFVEKDITYVDGHHEEFQSDYDIMVVMKDVFAQKELDWYSLEKELQISFNQVESGRYPRPIKIIYENILDLDDKLRDGRYFYVDVKKEGIPLYDSWKYVLREPKNLSPEERLELQKEDFHHWFPSAEEFYDDFKSNLVKGRLNKSAFELHQAAERYLTTYLLVKNHYKPKEHDVLFLYQDVLEMDASFEWWFDSDDEYEEEMLILLRRCYVDSRYDKSFSITKEELEFLEKKVLWLREKVEEKCREIVG